jgi:aminoglycoside 6'-N-acetyltransferase I
MDLIDLGATANGNIIEQCARMLVDEFVRPAGWHTLDSASDEVERVLRDGFALAMVAEEDLVAGWIGGLPEYDGRVWELHPLVVRTSHRRLGVGRELVRAFEHEARARGGLTATLGTDDDADMTSLSNVDLYAHVAHYIETIADNGKEHPFLFYQKLGYVVTGVMPDANGPGRPDIYMSRKLR